MNFAPFNLVGFLQYLPRKSMVRGPCVFFSFMWEKKILPTTIIVFNIYIATIQAAKLEKFDLLVEIPKFGS